VNDRPMSPPRPAAGAWTWTRCAKLAFRVAIMGVVTFFIYRAVASSLRQFEEQRFDWKAVRPGWLVVSGLIYLVGSVPGWWFWHRVMEAMGQQPCWRKSLRAFYIGHLGKYVPGKAMVVVLRAGMVRDALVDGGVAAAAVFVETLTTIAVGAVLASVLIAWRFHHDMRLLGLALLLTFAAGVPAWPSVFRRVVLFLKVHRASPKIEPALQALDLRLMGTGWLMLIPSWLIMGTSLWAALAALPNPPASLSDPLVSLPLCTACVALALVAGFVSMIPGGVGVREFVVITLLAPTVGEPTAVISAVLLRLVWLIAELVVSAALYWQPRSAADREAPTR
jgi:glycosyltransferase 2 family protein